MAVNQHIWPWDSQPQEVAEVDPRWAQRGLKLAFVGQRHLWANGSWQPNGQTSTPTYTPGPFGLALNPASGFVSGVPSVCTTTGHRSIVFHGFQTNNATGRVFQDTTGDGIAEGEGFWVAGGGPFYLRTTTTGTGFKQFTVGAWNAPGNTWYSTGLTHDQSSLSNSPTQYANGVLHGVVTSSDQGTGAYKTGSGTIAIGNRASGASRIWPGFIRSLLIFDSLLTAAEHKELADNPNAIFAPRSIWVPVSAGAGGGSTITAAAGAATASTLTASSTAASTLTAAAGAATASTVAASSTASTITGTGLTAGASAITPATGAATASTMTGASTAAAAITPAAGAATGQTLVPASTVSSASMTPAAGAASAATFAASAVAASVAVAAAGASSAQTMAASAQAVAAINAAAGVATASRMASPAGSLSNAEMRELYDWVKDLHRIHGLTSGVDLVVTPTSRTAGAINQTIGEVGTTVTVTRV